VQAFAGHIQMHVQDKVIDLPTGHMLALERALPHELNLWRIVPFCCLSLGLKKQKTDRNVLHCYSRSACEAASRIPIWDSKKQMCTMPESGRFGPGRALMCARRGGHYE
jgi:hypothetical protein